jgi:5S rRNA maturation endonuclease (ribonuclease M5)/KaiC/GvpD/RAD55 family RecA-like ATPase
LIPGESKALTYINQRGWGGRPSGTEQMVLDVCPYCDNPNGKFFINVSGGEKDGLHDCKSCGEKGNLYQLKQKSSGSLGDDVVSMHDMAAQSRKPVPLPDFAALHDNLVNKEEYADVLEYLLTFRKFSLQTIERMKLGADKKPEGNRVIYPYFDAAGNPVFYKARTIPPAKKDFKAPYGRVAPLYNDTILKPEMEEVVMVEGEADTVALINQGYETVVGVPGASVKKADWIAKFDRIAPKTVYLMYDNDGPGQTNAKDMAIRLGIERVRNILLPDFVTEDGKKGKDINEYFAAGHTLEDFEKLKAEAKAFDVDGVQNVVDVLNELKTQIEGKGLKPKYDTPWESLNSKVGGFEDGDVIGIIAEGKVGKTTLAMNLIDYYADQGINSFLYCGEMQPVRLVRKWVSYKTQTPDEAGKSQLTAETIEEAKQTGMAMKGDLLFGYTRSMKSDDVFNTIRQAVRRYGVKVVCFDNLQLMVRSLDHATQETSNYTKAFKALAMELQILIILIIQPHRVPEGQIVSARNAFGSSAIEKDVDMMIALHRNRVAKIKEADFKGYMDVGENMEPQLLVRVDLSRFSAGGTTTLYIDGATSTVRSIGEDDVAALSQPRTGGGLIPTGEAVTV